MRFASLGSGSRGNATLISHRNTCILVDSGFSVRELERRLQKFTMTPSDLTAIVVTHEHQDHSQGVAALARKYQLPVYTTSGARTAMQWGDLPTWERIEPETAFAIDDIVCDPFTVPHDAAEPVQFVFSDGQRKLGLLTDTGKVTSHIVEKLYQLDGLMLECNHDAAMLAKSDYPDTLKRRVGGDYGHLNNQQSAQLLAQVDCSRLLHIVAMHLSQQNNSPERARAALVPVLGCDPDEIAVADQATGFDWLDI